MSVLVNRPAPDFVAPAVVSKGTIVEDFDSVTLRGKYAVVFSGRSTSPSSGWRKGQKGMQADGEGMAVYLAENAKQL